MRNTWTLQAVVSGEQLEPEVPERGSEKEGGKGRKRGRENGGEREGE